MNRRKTTKESCNLYEEESSESRAYEPNVHLTDDSGNGKCEPVAVKIHIAVVWVMTPCILIRR
jgi:hypothetical protein